MEREPEKKIVEGTQDPVTEKAAGRLRNPGTERVTAGRLRDPGTENGMAGRLEDPGTETEVSWPGAGTGSCGIRGRRAGGFYCGNMGRAYVYKSLA